MRAVTDPRIRFWLKVDCFSSPDGCWEWTASKDHNGYGKFGIGRATEGLAKAHRWAYECLVGPIPEGLSLDHLCRNRGCVNPDHLEPVTHRENILRGMTRPAENAAKTHCKRGHAFDAVNTYVGPAGKRVCVPCRNAWQRARYAARRNGVVIGGLASAVDGVAS